MAGESKPLIQTLERVTSKFLGRLSSLGARDHHDVLGYSSAQRDVHRMVPTPTPRPCVVDGLAVAPQAVPDMTVQVGVGIGFAVLSGSSGLVGSPATSVDSNYIALNKRAATTATAALAAAHATLHRYDLISVKVTASPSSVGVDESEIIDLWNAATLVYDPSGSPQVVMSHGEPDVVITAGTAGSGPPACPAGQIPLALVRVRPTATSITAEDVFDVRRFLAEYSSLGPGDAESWLDTSEFVVNTPKENLNADVNLNARVLGVAGAWRTSTAVSFVDGATMRASLLDANFSDYASFTGWVYVYLVVEDDTGHRPRRVGVSGDFGGLYDHCGVLVVSKIAPSLSAGSLAPSAAIRLPERSGNGTATPGSSKAVCVAAMDWDASTFRVGLRMLSGDATFIDGSGIDSPPPPPVPITGSAYASAGASATHVATWTCDFDTTLVKGPIALHIVLPIQVTNNTASEHRYISVFDRRNAGAGSIDAPRAYTMHPVTTVVSTSVLQFLLRDVPVTRNPSARGTSKGGLYVRSVLIRGGAATNNTLDNTYTPAPALVGYRWPQGQITV